MAFAVPIFPEYLAYTGDEDDLDLESQAIVIGRRPKRGSGAQRARAPMLGETERSHSAPNMGQRIRKQQTTKFGATDESDVSKVLRKKQAEQVSSRIEKAKSIDEGPPPAAGAKSRESANESGQQATTATQTPEEPNPAVKEHKRVSRGESVLVLLRRLSAGRMQMTKSPADKSKGKNNEDDSTV